MYAIIRAGGKQYKVQPGDKIRVEKINASEGSEVLFTDVLMVGGDQAALGQPTLEGAQVVGVVLRQDKYPKVIIFKKKRRQGYRRTRGHRQPYTEVFIKSLSYKGLTAEAELKTAAPENPAQAADSTESTKSAKKSTTRAKGAKSVAKKSATGAKKSKTASTKKAAGEKATTKKVKTAKASKE
jgi:large subunit ribosomal protein L21